MEACARARLPLQVVFDASTYCDPQAFAALADSRPDLTLVLSVARARNRAALKGLAGRPNVFVQLPGLLDSEVADRVPSMMKWAARHLPPEKVMFGSDRLGREAEYAAKVKALQAFAPAARRWVARDTALSVYGRALQRA
jgi:predicted TIM-barrel fold metal-dependent hydrolase